MSIGCMTNYTAWSFIHHCPHTQLLQMLLSWFAEFSDQQKNMMLARLLVHAWSISCFLDQALWLLFFYFCCFLLCRDRTKTRNGLGNGSIKLMICSPSGCGKCFHGCGLASALVTRTSMQVSPPAPLCAANEARWSCSQEKMTVTQDGTQTHNLAKGLPCSN